MSAITDNTIRYPSLSYPIKNKKKTIFKSVSAKLISKYLSRLSINPFKGPHLFNKEFKLLVSHSIRLFNHIQDPISVIPKELAIEIFSFFSIETLGKICLVNKEWKKITDSSFLWKNAIYRDLAFGTKKCTCHFEKKSTEDDNTEEFFSLPWQDFIKDCQKFKNIFPEKNIKDQLILVRIPKTLDGRLTTIYSLLHLIKMHFPLKNKDDYSSLIPIIEALENKSVDKSYWVMMTTSILPNSTNKSYTNQQFMINQLAQHSLIGYEVPETLEAIICVLARRLTSIEHASKDPYIMYTRCQDKVKDMQLVVGRFYYSDSLVDVYYNSNDKNPTCGIAALKKF